MTDLVARIDIALARVQAEPDLPAVTAAARPNMLAETVRRLAVRPEGRFVRDQWLDDPLVYLAVTTGDEDPDIDADPDIDVRAILGAYAPTAPDAGELTSDHWSGPSRYLVAVPELLAGLVDASGSQYSHWSETATARRLGELADTVADPQLAVRLADGATRLWQTRWLSAEVAIEDSFDLLAAAAQLHERLGPARFEQAIAAAAVLEGDLLVDAFNDGELVDTLAALVDGR